MRFLLLILILTITTSCSHFSGPKPQKKVFSQVWSKDLNPPYQTGNFPIALNGPAVHDGILYLNDNRGVIAAYHLDRGRLLWKFNDGEGYHSSPVVSGDYVIYGNVAGRLFARQKLTGKLKYSIDLGSSIDSTPLVIKGRTFLHLRNHKIMVLDTATGKILWGYKRSVPYRTTLQRTSVPVVYNGKIYIGFADGSVACLNVEDGALLWERKIGHGNKFVDVDATPLIWNNHLIVGAPSGNLTVLSPKTGNLVRKIDVRVNRTPIVVGRQLLVGDVHGTIHVYDQNFVEKNKVRISKGAVSSITPFKNYYLVSTLKGELIALDQKDFKVLEKIEMGHHASAFFGQPSVTEVHYAVYSSRHRLYVYKVL